MTLCDALEDRLRQAQDDGARLLNAAVHQTVIKEGFYYDIYRRIYNQPGQFTVR